MPSWESDGVDGGPSSLDLLLEWLAAPGNAVRWLNSARNVGGKRTTLITQVYNLFLSHGITHHGRSSINSKLWKFERQLDEVDTWLKQKGVSHFDVNEEKERQVVKICPLYREIAPLLRPSRLVKTTTSRPGQIDVDERNREDVGTTGEVSTHLQTDNPRKGLKIRFRNWALDGVDGGPSSLDVLLQWLADRGNVEKWVEAEGKRDGSRRELHLEIYLLFLSRSITHRTCKGIKNKLLKLMKQFNEAEQWLRKRGLRHFDSSKNSERAVLLICPHYRKLAPLLRPSASVGTLRPQARDLGDEVELHVEKGRSNGEVGSNQEDIEVFADFHTEGQHDNGVNPRWDADAQNGRPSSLDVLLEWLAIPGNAWLWYKATVTRDGSRREMRNEIYELLLGRGITYRTHLAIDYKMGEVIRQLVQARNWLGRRGLQRYSVEISEKTKRDVLRICPHYIKISPLFRPAKPQIRSDEVRTIDTMADSEDQSSDDDATPIQRGFDKAQAPAKRVRRQPQFQKVDTNAKWDSDNVDGSIAPLFRSVRSSAARSPQISSKSTIAAKSSEFGYDTSDDEGEATPNVCANQDIVFTGSKWDSDSVSGRPSSLNVLLKWIVTPGNAARWQEAARTADGSRWVIASEIYDLLLTHGIIHRTPHGAESKLRALEEQFDKAETWLMRNGIRHFQDTIETESIVLQLCPVYPKIESALRSTHRSAVTSTSHTNPNVEIDARFSRPIPPNLALATLSGSKRFRSEHPQQTDDEEVKPVSILEAEPEERREFFKLELQVKRDEAILVRAKARKELLDMGFPFDEVDRLLPLSVVDQVDVGWLSAPGNGARW